MRSLGTRALTIVLLLASAFPPPRVANFLIANVLRQESVEARKPIQARGRNRIGAPVRVDSRQVLACLSSADRMPLRTPQYLSHRLVSSARVHLPASPFLSTRENLRLRC